MNSANLARLGLLAAFAALGGCYDLRGGSVADAAGREVTVTDVVQPNDVPTADHTPAEDVVDVSPSLDADTMDVSENDVAPDVVDATTAPDVTDVPPSVDAVDVPIDAGPPPCPSGQTRCGDVCVDTATTPAHCGMCGMVCPTRANAVPACVAGTCRSVCNSGFADCDNDPSTGCEARLETATTCGSCGTRCDGATPLCQDVAGAYRCVSGCSGAAGTRCGMSCVDPQTDAQHCGACDRACTVPPNGRATCAGGTCGIACNTGYHVCGTACADDTAVASCGTRCEPCPARANAAATCAMGACGFTCNAGFADCDGDANNGCEVDTRTTVAHCGMCGRACATPANGTPTCAAGNCGIACTTGYHACGTSCADDTAVATCGTLCTTCPARANASSTCSSGSCGYTCNAGFADCDGSAANGCEVDTRTSTTNCGMCGRQCGPYSNADQACVNGSCAIAMCRGATGDCNANIADGCETLLSNSVAHCGRCGNACPARANASANCAAGACGLSCHSGFADCDGDPANGCEVDTTSSGSHCGMCGRACASGTVCLSGNCTTILAPRQVAPISISTVTSQRPTLRWLLAAGADGARVQICADRDCTVVRQVIDVVGTSARSATALTPGVHYWRLYARRGTDTFLSAVSPTWEFIVGARSAAVDTSNGAMLDVNGDGYADVAVGAHYEGTNDRVFVYHGGSGGLATTPSITLTGPNSFGRCVASAGDVNGDGFGDLIVGASGQSSIFLGSARGLASTPAATLAGMGIDVVRGVSGAGDLNGDGYSDVVVGRLRSSNALVYHGGPGGPSTTPAASLSGPMFFGRSVSAAGDINGDGYSDLAVSSEAGQAFVYLGGRDGVPTSPTTTFTGVSPFGMSVVGAGDLNGDGYADVLVGSPGGGTAEVFAYMGSATGISTTPARTVTGSGTQSFGYSLAGMGDLNADGYADVLVGSAGTAGVSVYLGGPSGLNTSSARVLSGSRGYGISVAIPGDVNGDGYSDVMIGTSPDATGNSMGAFLFLGIGSGLAASASSSLSGPGYFGLSVAALERRAVTSHIFGWEQGT